MKKIPTLFVRNFEEGGDRQVRDEIHPEAAWVAAGEGVATRKFDGTCCMVKDGGLYRRFEAKAGKPVPEGFEPCQDIDPVTGNQPGWIPVDDKNSADKYHCEAEIPSEDGTYELCGPKIQSNREKFGHHVMVRHGEIVIDDFPRTFAEIRDYLATHDIEGVVWYHPDGRMAKIKCRDFGIRRGVG